MKRTINCLASTLCAVLLAGATPGEARTQEPYAVPADVENELREMKEVLGDLVTVQEHHFADYVEYTHSFPTLMSHFRDLARRPAWDVRRPSAEVTFVLLQVTNRGWNAVAVHEQARGYACAIYIGYAPPPFDHGSDEGEPTCVGPEGEQLE